MASSSGQIYGRGTENDEGSNVGGSGSRPCDSESNLLNKLTQFVRTTRIDNGGCQFTIVERNSKIEFKCECEGHGSDWVDVIGDSSTHRIVNVPVGSKRRKPKAGLSQRTFERVNESKGSSQSGQSVTVATSPPLETDGLGRFGFLRKLKMEKEQIASDV